MKNQENLDQKIVAIFMTFVIVVAIIFCFLIYDNQVRGRKLDVAEYEVTELLDKANITNVSQEENYVKIEGEFLEEIQTYEIYIALEDEAGEMKKYRTELCEDQKFYTLIPSKHLKKGATINIVYQCNEEKIFIKTNKIVGEEANG